MAEFNSIYRITNENIRSYNGIYDFYDAQVLSVAGSGDQYFASLLYGAKAVDLYDINYLAWYYFILKFRAIENLTYEEFYTFFITCKLNNKYIFNKLDEYLPDKVKEFFSIYLKSGFDNLLNSDLLYRGPEYPNDGIIIPFFEINSYYKLQELLKQIKLPNFYNCNIIDLKSRLESHYDIMLCSNIEAYLHMPAFEYKRFLEKFNIPEIQAHYLWNSKIPHNNFLDAGFIEDLVLPTNGEDDIKYNVVLSLKK